MNIYQKLIEVRKTVPYLQKESKGFQYKYTASSQVLAAVRAKMDELWLLLIPEVLDHNVTAAQDSKGRTSYFTELDMRMTWVDAENPEERIQSTWYAQGLDLEGEKGVGKAMTYGEKYFMLKFFNIATDKDDPDSFQRENGVKETPPSHTRREPRKPQNDTTTPADSKPVPKDWTRFWLSLKDAGINRDLVHSEAAPYFNLPNPVTKLNEDIPGLTVAKLEAYRKHLIDGFAQKSA